MERLMLNLVVGMVVCIMVNCSGKGEVSIQDTTPPSEPTGLSGASTSSTSVVLNWNASTDNVGVAGYKVYRNGNQISDSVSTSCTDTSLASSTTYFYAVAAYDAAANISEKSSIISVTTLTLNTPGGSANNNITMIDSMNNLVGGANDVNFIWDGTMKTSVAISGQVSNATLSSTCPIFGITWIAHDVAIYGPGTYKIYTGCPAGSPGCGVGTPITFTVGAGEIGGHMLFNGGGSTDIDVVNVWKPKSVFGPSPLYAGGCGSNSASTIWGWMSKDVTGNGVNGYPMAEGPFVGRNVNFNLMGEANPCDGKVCNDNNACTTDICEPTTGSCVFTPIKCDDSNPCTDDTCDQAIGCVYTPNNKCTSVSNNNNFTLIDVNGTAFSGTNDVHFTWDGTMKTSVAASGQVSNATLSSTCPIFGATWGSHDMAIYGPGSYTIFDGCAAGSPGCGTGNPITFTVGLGQLGGHILFSWNGNDDIDVVNVWQPGVFAPSSLWTGACGSNPANKVWNMMSTDWDVDGINGAGMTDGPFVGSSVNFNLMQLN